MSTFSETQHPRISAGVQGGGRFAAKVRVEPGVTLAEGRRSPVPTVGDRVAWRSPVRGYCRGEVVKSLPDGKVGVRPDGEDHDAIATADVADLITWVDPAECYARGVDSDQQSEVFGWSADDEGRYFDGRELWEEQKATSRDRALVALAGVIGDDGDDNAQAKLAEARALLRSAGYLP